MTDTTNPKGMGKPKGSEPTPIEVVYRELRALTDKPNADGRIRVPGWKMNAIAEMTRQAAILDSQRSVETQRALLAARADLSTVRAEGEELADAYDTLVDRWMEIDLLRSRQQKAFWLGLLAGGIAGAGVVIVALAFYSAGAF